MFVKSFCVIRDLVSHMALFKCVQLIVCCFGFQGWNSNPFLFSYFKLYFRPLLSSDSSFVEKTLSVFTILAWNIKRFQVVLQRVSNTCVSKFFVFTSQYFLHTFVILIFYIHNLDTTTGQDIINSTILCKCTLVQALR